MLLVLTSGEKMTNLFPKPIKNLPVADMPFVNYEAFISQAENHQIIFMQFGEDIDLPEHSHESQWGIVLEGRIITMEYTRTAHDFYYNIVYDYY